MAKKAISKKEAMKMAGEKASPYGNYLLVNNDKLNRAIFGNVGRGGQMEGGAGEKATPELVIAEYDKLGGLILTKGGEKDGWLFQGKPLTSVEVQQLREEANYISGMKLWRAIKLDIRWQLSKKMFEDARVQDDLVWGQLLMFLDDIIRQRIKK